MKTSLKEILKQIFYILNESGEIENYKFEMNDSEQNIHEFLINPVKNNHINYYKNDDYLCKITKNCLNVEVNTNDTNSKLVKDFMYLYDKSRDYKIDKFLI